MEDKSTKIGSLGVCDGKLHWDKQVDENDFRKAIAFLF